MKKLICLIALISLFGCDGSDDSRPYIQERDPEDVRPPVNEFNNYIKHRFVERATFGSTSDMRKQIEATSLDEWIETQKNLPATLHYPILNARLEEGGYIVKGNDFSYERVSGRRDLWWEVAVTAEDQLRQRVAFALSQILVVSDAAMISRSRGIANYYDIFVRNAFGNYRDIIEEVTYHPMMGIYLSHRGNVKEDVSRGTRPDENYARELMQLFTIGIWELNMDGTPRLDQNGDRIPSYTQEDVEEYARVFTGLNYWDSTHPWSTYYTVNSDVQPMKAYEQWHDTNPKNLLGGYSADAGLSVAEDIDIALDSLFNHPNVAPFISKQLIQRFVTSNPSPEYVQRVAEVFVDNGSGVRGDLGAVVAAVLLDEEAIHGYYRDSDNFGKLKEPVLKITKLWREFEADGVVGKYRLYDTRNNLGQLPMASPSVFNFFQPDYSPSGELANSEMLSPESQILNEYTFVNIENLLQDYAKGRNFGSGARSGYHTINLNVEDLVEVAETPLLLVEQLNERLLMGGMSIELKLALADYLETISVDDGGEGRAREALALVLMSPDFSIQK